jgi:ubiquitin carboxyl-terminal hydrolase 10
VPVIPKPVSRAASGAPASEHNYVDTSETKAPEEETATTKPDVADGAPKDEAQETKDEAQPIKAAPLTWSGLFKATAAQANSQSAIIDQVNNSGPPSLASGGKAKNETIADVLRAFSASAGKLTFLKPRGLINTGNMCYMNSVCPLDLSYDTLDTLVLACDTGRVSLTPQRCCKFLSSAFRSIISWTWWVNGRRTASKVIPP